MDESAIVIKLVKRKVGGLGFLVKERASKPCVEISDIVKGSAAEGVSNLQPGDIILEVNGKSIEESHFKDAVDVLSGVETGSSVSLKIKPSVRSNGSAKTSSKNIKENVTQPINGNVEEPSENANKPKNEEARENGTTETVNGQSDPEVNDNMNGVASGILRCPFSQFSEHAKSPKYVKLKNWVTGQQYTDTLHQKSKTRMHCTAARCEGSLMRPYGGENPSPRPYGIPRPKEEVREHAVDFLEQYYTSMKMNNSPAHEKRLAEVLKDIEATGSYDLTEKELMFGARMAWRNASRCIGRIQWNRLHLFDARDVFTARGMYEAIIRHIKYGTNKGNIRSTITVFPHRREPHKDFRVWNTQLIQYAGYKQPDGSVIGDPAGLELTEICVALGWKPKGGRFDVLPLVLQAGGERPEYFEIPEDLILEVKLKHPKYDWFEELGLRWYALPAVSCLCLDVGGIEFPGCPFNGWYMVTEIGARDLGDPCRYNMLEPVAKKLGLDTKSNASLWKDISCVEINVAVLYSFQEAGVTITDHHTASETFMKHFENETKLRGGCPGDWVWVVPPLSGSVSPVFHQEMLNYMLKPSYEYQDDPWKHYKITTAESNSDRKKLSFKEVAKAVKFSANLMGKAMAKRTKAIILYATETGKSESYARMLADLFLHAFDPKVMRMDEYPHPEMENEQLILIVTSTFGNGDPPENGESFARYLYELRHPSSQGASTRKIQAVSNLLMQKEKERGLCIKDDEQPLASLRYAVFGLGSRAYPNFCAFARSLDKIIQELGAEQIHKCGEGDELAGQEESFKTWAKQVFKAACDTFCVGEMVNVAEADESLNTLSSGWSPGKYRFTSVKEELQDVCKSIASVNNKPIVGAKVKSVKKLQSADSSRSTILLKLDTSPAAEFHYNPGDHLSVFPCNRRELVQSLIDRLCEAPDPDQPIKLEVCQETSGPFGKTKKWTPVDRLPTPTTVREAFSRFIDIAGTPTPQILKSLASLATNPKDREALETLGKGDNHYDDWKYEKQSNIVEVLEEFPSVNVEAEMLLTQLPLLQPRFYSISSSQDFSPNEVHLTVAVVQYNKREGKGPVHYGVCSTWFNGLKPGDIVPCFVRKAHSFHLPDDGSLPIIMVGPGTGIAPFRSFWQQRQYDIVKKPSPVPKPRDAAPVTTNGDSASLSSAVKEGSGWGDMVLYFGCRCSTLDDIYQEETKTAHQDGALAAVRTALSREPGHVKKLLEEYAAMTQQEAQEFIDNLKSSGRYHEDIFGVTLRTREVTNRVRTAARKAWVYVATAKKIKKSSVAGLLGGINQDTNDSPRRGSPKYPLDRSTTLTVHMRSDEEVIEEEQKENLAKEAKIKRFPSLQES
ncbi:nitric oxide synthase, brain isoform X2 [Nematostella vectensis]|uniref:nitric oxide synthase, brain isoform X2 n=1 Tax=Nematostella vectensis TaxID=45351 RepID=UPI00138FBDCB|nr:nitric oxide synthase, brain isoform X2 [Nematostella vectensis]